MRTTSGKPLFDNVVFTDNGGHGLAFDITDDPDEITITNSTFSTNGEHGVRFPSSVALVDGITIDGCLFQENGTAGLLVYSLDTANFVVSNSSFIGNASGDHQLADIVFSGWHGDVAFSNVTITSNTSESGIRFSGKSAGLSPNKKGSDVAGVIALTDVTISGTQDLIITYPSAAIVMTRYLDLTNVSFDNVVLDSVAPVGLFFGTVTDGLGPDLGDLFIGADYTEFIRYGKHGNSGSYAPGSIDIDATGVTFEGASNSTAIENGVHHFVDDNTLGTVTWTAP